MMRSFHPEMPVATPEPGVSTHRPYQGLLTDLLVASLPLLATFASYLPSGIAMPFRLVSLGCVAVALASSWKTRRLDSPITFWVVAAVSSCFVLFGAIGWLRYPDSVAREDVVRTGYLLLLVVAIPLIASRLRTIIFLVGGWFISAGISAVVGVWEIITWNHLPRNIPAQYHAGVLPDWNEISAFFDNPNLYAYHCVVVLLMVPILWAILPRYWRLICLPIAAILGVLLINTDGRIGFIAAGVGVGIWALRSRISRWLMVGSAAVIAVATWLKTPFTEAAITSINATLYQFVDEGASGWVRVQLARAGWWMVEESSYLGVGPGGFASWVLRPDNPYPYKELTSAHSGIVEIGADYGLITLIGFIAALVAVMIYALRCDRGPTPVWSVERTIVVGAGIMAATWPLLSATHSSWLPQPLAAAHLATLIGFIAWAEHHAKES